MAGGREEKVLNLEFRDSYLSSHFRLCVTSVSVPSLTTAD